MKNALLLTLAILGANSFAATRNVECQTAPTPTGGGSSIELTFENGQIFANGRTWGGIAHFITAPFGPVLAAARSNGDTMVYSWTDNWGNPGSITLLGDFGQDERGVVFTCK